MTPIVTEPVYKQLARLCRETLENGDFAPGDRFPSERELAAQHGVSRVTANKVIAGLVAEKRLEHRPGIGMFVLKSHELNLSLREVRSFTSHARSLGLEPETQVLKWEARKVPPSDVAQVLGLKSREKAYFVERLRLANGEPLILERRWIRAQLTPGLTRKDLDGSFYALLENRFGLVPTGEKQTIRAVNLSADDAAILKTHANAAALEVEGQGFTGEGVAIWHQVLVYRGDRYQLENLVEPQGVQPGVLRLQPAEK